MTTPGGRTFLFVYAADSGLANALLDLAHKTISPSTYPCDLCALTYGPLGMRRVWARFVRTLPGRVRFLHRDELAREYPATAARLPALYEDAGGGTLTMRMTPEEMHACRGLDDLMGAVRRAAAL